MAYIQTKSLSKESESSEEQVLDSLETIFQMMEQFEYDHLIFFNNTQQIQWNEAREIMESLINSIHRNSILENLDYIGNLDEAFINKSEYSKKIIQAHIREGNATKAHHRKSLEQIKNSISDLENLVDLYEQQLEELDQKISD